MKQKETVLWGKTTKQLQDQKAMVCSGRKATIVIRLVQLKKGLLRHRTKRRVHSEPHPGKHPIDKWRKDKSSLFLESK